ncbi:MAG: amino acid ABC transporter permease [Clostridiales bacterium]|nr:amino acid ABC transporter permease [Clostridiales bacterium]
MEFVEIIQMLLDGFGKTLLLFAITLIASLPLGLLISFGSRSKFLPVKWFCRGLVWVIRGTPLMLQILAVTLIPYYVFRIGNSDITSFLDIKMKWLLFSYAAIAFIINYACYFSEIFRGAIESVPKGQYEAGKVLGMTKNQIFRKVILFQVIKKSLAPVSNEVITLVKDTALASVAGVLELYTTAQSLVNTYVVLTPLLYAAIFYLIFNGLLTLLFGFIEKKFSFYSE